MKEVGVVFVVALVAALIVGRAWRNRLPGARLGKVVVLCGLILCILFVVITALSDSFEVQLLGLALGCAGVGLLSLIAGDMAWRIWGRF